MLTSFGMLVEVRKIVQIHQRGSFKGVAIEHTGIKCQKRKHETERDTLRGKRSKIENGRNKQH